MKLLRVRNKKGFSLTEILVTLGLTGLVMVGVFGFSFEAIRFNQNRYLKIIAGEKLIEYSNAINILKNDNWNEIINNSDGTDKHISINGGVIQINDGILTEGEFTIRFNVNSVFRDVNNNIVESGGFQDLGSRRIDMLIQWNDQLGFQNSINSSGYISNWNSRNYIETSVQDFSDGTNNLVTIDNQNGGEVRLDSVVYADWCKPTLSTTNFDLPGQGVARAIWGIPGEVFMGTGGNASGLSFINATINNNTPPGVGIVGTLDGYKTNGVFGENDYAYITTDDNGQEVAILDIRTTPFQVVGSFNAPGSSDGVSVYVSNNVGYVTTGSSLYIFNLSSKTGSRAQLGSINLGHTAGRVIVRGNYAYVAVASNNNQVSLIIVNVTNPATPVNVASIRVNGGLTKDIFVSEDGNRVYLVTASSSSLNEFFIINTTNKSGTLPVISSYDTNGMNPEGVAVTPDSFGRAIIVGTGAEEYQVLNITNEASPTRCGGTNYDSGIYGISTVINSIGDAFSYITTANTTQELSLIKGGPGGGNGQGQGFANSGDYISNVIDTGSGPSNFYSISWNAAVPSGTQLRFQLRSGDSSNLSSQSWSGPDGTAATFYLLSSGENISSIIQNRRYIQYRAYFSSDTISTPILNDITINYAK